MTPREYWTSQMDAAFAFMEAMRSHRVVESGEKMASMVDATRGLDVFYNEFLMDGKYPQVWYIREGIIDKYRAAMKAFNDRGWRPKIISAYRSPQMQAILTRRPHNVDRVVERCLWERDGQVPDGELVFRRLTALIATRCRCSGHLCGAAVDYSFIDRKTGKEMDRGGAVPEISERAPMASPFVTPEQHENRRICEEIFREHGFVPYPYEFWHFSMGDSYDQFFSQSGQPSRYGTIYFRDGQMEPMDPTEAEALINPVQFYADQIAESLERIAAQKAAGS